MTTKLAACFLLSYVIIAGVDKIASFAGANRNYNAAFPLPGAASAAAPTIIGDGGESAIKRNRMNRSPQWAARKKRSTSSAGEAGAEEQRDKRELYDLDYEEDQEETPKPGLIGCKFSKEEELCDSKSEWCFDDYAFGRCLNIYSPNPAHLYRYHLTKSNTHGLENEMERLYAMGYRWNHVFTQCTLQTLLDSIEQGTKWDRTPCRAVKDSDIEGAIQDLRNEVDDPSSGTASIRFSPDDNADYADEMYIPPPILETSAAGSPIVLDDIDGQLSLAFLKSLGKSRQKSQKLPSLKAQLSGMPIRKPGEVPGVAEDDVLADVMADYLLRSEGKKTKTQKKSVRKTYPVLVDDDDDSNDFVANTRWLDNPAQLSAIEDMDSFALIKALTAAAEAEELEGQWEERPVAEVGPVDEEDISPRIEPQIFTGTYNTPGMFRRGIETKDKLDTVFLDTPLSKLQVAYEMLPEPLKLQEAEEDAQVASGFEEFADPATELTSSNKPLFTEGGTIYANSLKRQLFYDDRSRAAFERQERLDVKKPGPWYPSVNNYAFNHDHEEHTNPEFQADEGPADMQLPSVDLEEVVSDDENIPEFHTSEDDVLSEKLVEKKKSASRIMAAEHWQQPEQGFVKVFLEQLNRGDAAILTSTIAQLEEISPGTLNVVKQDFDSHFFIFKIAKNAKGLDANTVAGSINRNRDRLYQETNLRVLGANAGETVDSASITGPFRAELGDEDLNRYLFLGLFACILFVSTAVGAWGICLIRRHAKQQEKLAKLVGDDPDVEACKSDYQELCRARVASKNNEKVETMKSVQRAMGLSKGSEDGSSSSRSSTSSSCKCGGTVVMPERNRKSSIETLLQVRRASGCSVSSLDTFVVLTDTVFENEEPVMTNMDISTGHMVLSYMEDHLKKKDRLDEEWAALCKYEAEPCSTKIAEKPENQKKNRFTNSLPYDHARVVLNELANVNGTDFINASTITDHDPRNPAYIASQGPLQNTAADFWQMVWEQGSVVIVTLTKISDNGTNLCHRYWPEEGSELYHIYEVHLVSEHIWCEDYLVRSFYLKNVKTGETRTVTQFHFLAWPENSIPSSTKSLLEFRRKVNKSYRGRSCPIIVHCSDGAGRTGTYCLIDMVLNRMAKGAKEIDIAASLEHIRDQRPGMVRTKQQFEFVLMAVAEEVHAILKALPQ